MTPSPIIKRSITISHQRTSVSLEGPFWEVLKSLAAARGLTLSELVSRIDAGRSHHNLSCALRLFVLAYYQGAPQ